LLCRRKIRANGGDRTPRRDGRADRAHARQLRRIGRDHPPLPPPIDREDADGGGGPRHPSANAISYPLGIEPTFGLDRAADARAPGGRSLLCSDRLTKVVSDAEIALVIELLTPGAASRRFVRRRPTAGRRKIDRW
jgi:serine/threonine protein phosphatase Stp1